MVTNVLYHWDQAIIWLYCPVGGRSPGGTLASPRSVIFINSRMSCVKNVYISHNRWLIVRSVGKRTQGGEENTVQVLVEICTFSTHNILEFLNVAGLGTAGEATGPLQPTVQGCIKAEVASFHTAINLIAQILRNMLTFVTF